ncbi:hypothetical protein D6D11_06466 [Aureobasidium pullulans]|nr:hypothetical protein D6D11_06466 [Aureobasidium pullulans]
MEREQDEHYIHLYLVYKVTVDQVFNEFHNNNLKHEKSWYKITQISFIRLSCNSNISFTVIIFTCACRWYHNGVNRQKL